MAVSQTDDDDQGEHDRVFNGGRAVFGFKEAFDAVGEHRLIPLCTSIGCAARFESLVHQRVRSGRFRKLTISNTSLFIFWPQGTDPVRRTSRREASSDYSFGSCFDSASNRDRPMSSKTTAINRNSHGPLSWRVCHAQIPMTLIGTYARWPVVRVLQ
jgi:hypothetical protein